MRHNHITDYDLTRILILQTRVFGSKLERWVTLVLKIEQRKSVYPRAINPGSRACRLQAPLVSRGQPHRRGSTHHTPTWPGRLGSRKRPANSRADRNESVSDAQGDYGFFVAGQHRHFTHKTTTRRHRIGRRTGLGGLDFRRIYLSDDGPGRDVS